MKKLTAILLIAALTLALTGCTGGEVDPNAPDFNRVCAEGRRDTPVRAARGILNFTLDKEYTLDLTVEHSDLIVDVTIIEWLGELTGDGCVTFFRARVNATIKGEEFEEITIIQSGNSEFAKQGFPLFKNGDRLLVFLKNEEGVFDNKYWITGCWSTFFSILEYENNPFLLSRGGWIHEELLKNDSVERIGGELWVTVNEQFKKHDPFLVGLWDSIIETERNNNPAMVELMKERSVSPELYKPEYRDVFNYDDVIRIILDMVEEERQ
jgi:hypothetical protein